MKKISKNQTEQFKNSDKCIATEYLFGDKDINSTYVEILGRYPEKGRVVNLKCKEIAYIIEGSGKIVVENKVIELKEGDMVLIEAGERIYWEGDMKMIASCNPAWYAKQHKDVE